MQHAVWNFLHLFWRCDILPLTRAPPQHNRDEDTQTIMIVLLVQYPMCS